MKILIVEDDEGIRSFLKKSLETEFHSTDTASTGSDGSFLARTSSYDVIILDHSLPVKNGLNVCQEIRNAGVETPILFLTVHRDIQRKVSALNKGADDYMTKPFSFEELHARIQALARRPPKLESTLLRVGDLVLDTKKQSALRTSIPIYFTRKEYNLLEYLMKNKGVVVSRAMLMEHVWNADSDPFSNTI
ncbi:MAG: response regulator transcription factor, partial [Patescibacteria group bacterium]